MFCAIPCIQHGKLPKEQRKEWCPMVSPATERKSPSGSPGSRMSFHTFASHFSPPITRSRADYLLNDHGPGPAASTRQDIVAASTRSLFTRCASLWHDANSPAHSRREISDRGGFPRTVAPLSHGSRIEEGRREGRPSRSLLWSCPAQLHGHQVRTAHSMISTMRRLRGSMITGRSFTTA